jgi:hypothetical protein
MVWLWIWLHKLSLELVRAHFFGEPGLGNKSTVELNNVSHIVTGLSSQDGQVYATVKILKTPIW